MIGYKVNLPNDSVKRKNFDSSISLIHKFHPNTQSTQEKKQKKAQTFYKNSLRISEEKTKDIKEMQRIKKIKENISSWS